MYTSWPVSSGRVSHLLCVRSLVLSVVEQFQSCVETYVPAIGRRASLSYVAQFDLSVVRQFLCHVVCTHLVLSVVGNFFCHVILLFQWWDGVSVMLLVHILPFQQLYSLFFVYTYLGLSVVRQFLCHVMCTHYCPVSCETVFLSCCMYTYCPVGGETVYLSCCMYTYCLGCCSGQSMSPYCDIVGMEHLDKLSCLSDYKAFAYCDLHKHRSVIDAKFQV